MIVIENWNKIKYKLNEMKNMNFDFRKVALV